MPVVYSHHRLIGNDRFLEYDNVNKKINAIVSNITFDILKDSPGLVAEVANGNVERHVLEKEIIKNIDRNRYHLGLYREELIKKVFDFMFGYGELQQYIEDQDISDIDGTRYNEFVVKRKGIREKIDVNFGSEKIFDTYCKLIAIRNGGILNENDSHCRVTDENYRLRINVSISPRNANGPSISIRKHRKNSYTIQDLKKLGMIDDSLEEFIKQLACSDATILFCGKGAAGKTTLLRAFVNILPEMERVLIAESDTEIYPDKPYCIQQRIKKQNEGGRPVTLKDLVRDGLTMSLDTYCIGEIVGEEAWEFVKASFTGHRGIATLHSESAEDAFGRLLTLCQGAALGESERTIKEIMSKSIDVIFYLSEFKVVDVLEIVGYQKEKDRFVFNRLFLLDNRYGDKNGCILGSFIKCNDPGERLKRKLTPRGKGNECTGTCG
ncbi:MAG TPA: CpaF family protein [Clostridiaceae bacterium]|nr:CpaF family protein [Clostridiaceae bacterium]